MRRMRRFNVVRVLVLNDLPAWRAWHWLCLVA